MLVELVMFFFMRINNDTENGKRKGLRTGTNVAKGIL